MPDLESVLMGIESVERAGIQCPLNEIEPRCLHFPQPLIDDVVELLKKQAKQIDDLKAELAKTEDNFSEYAEMMQEKQEPMKPDCEHAEHDGIGCLGYAACWQDDEPIDACKNCREYTGNRCEEVSGDD